jgi:predicted 3-demethylubiquinone-9 3-methyltransferase (glyoxalase superfamily)
MSQSRLLPFLWYAHDAEAAARHYVSIFPDSSVDRVTSLGVETPSGPPGSVSVVEFTLMGQRLQAMTAGPHHEFNDAISLMVECDSQAELDRYWDALLADGGRPQACGWLIDRFGVRWQIVPAGFGDMMASPNRDGANRAARAMMQMIKFDIAALQAAFNA